MDTSKGRRGCAVDRNRPCDVRGRVAHEKMSCFSGLILGVSLQSSAQSTPHERRSKCPSYYVSLLVSHSTVTCKMRICGGANLLDDQRDSPGLSIECDETTNITTRCHTGVVEPSHRFTSASKVSAPRFVALSFRCESYRAECARFLRKIESEIARNCRCPTAVPPSTSERVPR